MIDLHERAGAAAEALPGAELDHPFGPEWDVWKVRGKVFLLLAVQAGDPIANVKADPEVSRLLREANPAIEPGFHMNKRHWITMRQGPGLDEALVGDLVAESYLLVAEGLPRSRRPVDPEAFAAARGEQSATA